MLQQCLQLFQSVGVLNQLQGLNGLMGGNFFMWLPTCTEKRTEQFSIL